MLLFNNEYGRVIQTKTSQGSILIEIEHLFANAKISLFGGQVISWQPVGENEVFWLSKNLAVEKGKAIRGGIPLCWPWFGKHPQDSENSAGNHGFVRDKNWNLETIKIDENNVEIRLSWQGDNMSALWPNQCKLEQRLTIGKTFKQILTMQNLSSHNAYYTSALHNYFLVSSPNSVVVNGLSESTFFDKMSNKICEPKKLTNCTGPVDRIYNTNNSIQLVDKAWNRIIELKTTNTHHWVLWNPGLEIAESMIDIHSNGEQEFVCLEPANTNETLLSSGAEIKISQEISIINH